jgi:hypothetical protein
MQLSTQLQFKLMAPEAQRSALQRLALRGMSAEQIAEHTGLDIANVREAIGSSITLPAWMTAATRLHSARRAYNSGA